MPLFHLSADVPAYVPGGMVLLVAAAVAWYVTTYALLAVPLARRSPGWRGLIQALPTLLAVLALTVGGRSDVAAALAVATPLATLLLAGGIALSTAVPHAHGHGHGCADGHARVLPAWRMLIAVALTLLVGGFGGRLGLLQAAALLAHGGLTVWVWNAPGDDRLRSNPAEPSRVPLWLLGITLGLCLALGGVGGWAAETAIARTESWTGRPGGTAVAALVLAPLLVLPTLGGGSALVRERPDALRLVLGGHVASALAGLCLTLPLAILLTTASRTDRRTGLFFPEPVWRIDTVFLTLVGFALLTTLAMRDARLTRRCGVTLLLVYALYLRTAAGGY